MVFGKYASLCTLNKIVLVELPSLTQIVMLPKQRLIHITAYVHSAAVHCACGSRALCLLGAGTLSASAVVDLTCVPKARDTGAWHGVAHCVGYCVLPMCGGCSGRGATSVSVGAELRKLRSALRQHDL